MYDVLFMGTLTGPVCGELKCNLILVDGVRGRGVKVKAISTALSNNGVPPGKFSLIKMLKSVWLVIVSLPYLLASKGLYLTPGLTGMGILRFLPLILIAKVLGRPVVMHYHGARLPKTIIHAPKYIRPLLVWALGLPDSHIFLADNLKELHVGTHAIAASEVIPNFVSDQIFRRASGGGHVKAGALFLGSIFREKGVFEVVETIEKLSKLGCSLPLEIVGAGREENDLNSVLENLMTLGLEINYRGGVYDLDRLADYYLGAKYFIFPSRYDQEALPLVIMEAMACGCVVISSNVGGVSGLIDSGFDGLTLDDCSPENIALTILELEDNNELTEALSVNARIKAKEWTETRYVDRVQEVIDFYILKQRRGYGKA